MNRLLIFCIIVSVVSVLLQIVVIDSLHKAGTRLRALWGAVNRLGDEIDALRARIAKLEKEEQEAGS